MGDIVEAASQAEEDAAFLAGAKIVIRTDLLPVPVVPGVIEDFSTFVEVDPKGVVTILADSVSFASLTRASSTYVYKDYGEDHFEDFSIDAIYRVTACSSGTSNFNGGLIGLSNAVGDREMLRLAKESILGLLAGNSGVNRFLCINEQVAGLSYNSAFFNPALNTDYYLTFDRDMTAGTYGTASLKIYADSERSQLLTVLTLPLRSSLKYRNLYVLQSVNSGLSTVAMSGSISRLEIN